MKFLGELLVFTLIGAFLFYLVVYIVMGFPKPQWMMDASQQVIEQTHSPQKY
jgi:hypothetical protein